MFQMELDNLETWCRRWQLVLNPKKTEMLRVIGKKGGKLKNIGNWQLRLGGVGVESVEAIKYLGVKID